MSFPFKSPNGPTAPTHPTDRQVEQAPQSAVRFDRLQPFTCRWIFGVTSPTALCCGRPVVLGLSWCSAHAKRVFTRPSLSRPAAVPAQVEEATP